MERTGRPTRVLMWTFVLVQVLFCHILVVAEDNTTTIDVTTQTATPTSTPTTAAAPTTTEKSFVGGNCTNDSNCVANLTCDNGKCKVKAGQRCNNNIECVANANCNTNNNTCQCTPDFYNDNGNCTLKLKAGQRCTNNTECVANAICTTNNNTCQCTPDFYNDNGNCTLKKILSAGQDCSNITATTCASNLTCENNTCRYTIGSTCTDNAVCVNGSTCQYSNAGGIKTCRVLFNGGCNSTIYTPCVEHANCSSMTCQCWDSHYPVNGECQPRKNVNEVCTSTTPPSNGQGNCLPGSVCEDNGATHLCKFAISSTCSNNDTCVQTAKCQSESQSASPGGKKICRVSVSNDCSGSKPCVLNATCAGTTCQCMQGYYAADGECAQRISTGHNCDKKIGVEQSNCIDDNVCDFDGTCKINFNIDCNPQDDKCAQNFTCSNRGGVNKCLRNVDQMCSSALDCINTSTCDNKKCKITYGNHCDDENCTSDLSCRAKQCLCKNGTYRINGKCSGVDQLAVKTIARNGQEEKMLSVSWSGPSEVDITHNLTYKATINPNASEIIWTNNFANFTDRTPGTRYNIAIVTRVLQDPEYDTQMVESPSVPASFYTKPAKPGPLTATTFSAENTTGNVTITFKKSDGNVEKYNLAIYKDAQNVENQTDTILNDSENIVQATFRRLVVGVRYNVRIVAIAGNISSEEEVDMFRVQTRPAGQVNATINAYDSRWANLVWSRPAAPNGDIRGYIIEFNPSYPGARCIFVEVKCNNSNNCSTLQDENRSKACDIQNVTNYNLTALDTANLTFTANVTSLMPGVNYTVKLAAYNEEGKGADLQLAVLTETEAAADLKSFSVTAAGEHILNVSWTNGERRGDTWYNITMAKETGIGTGIYIISNERVLQGYERSSEIFNNLLSYWHYNVTIVTWTSKGPSTPNSRVALTEESKPGNVTNLKSAQDGKIATILYVTFNCPEEEQRNGDIKFFHYEVLIGETSTRNDSWVNTGCNNKNFTYTVSIRAEEKYTVKVYAVTAGNKNGTVSVISDTAKALAPVFTFQGQDKPLTQSSRAENSVSVAVSDAIFDTSQGRLKLTGILVCLKDSNKCTANVDIRNASTWRQMSTTGWYRTTPDDWQTQLVTKTSSTGRRKRTVDRLLHRVTRETATYLYAIGTNTSCSDDPTDHCNGQLQPGKTYFVKISSCTDGGCAYTDNVEVQTVPRPVTDSGAIIGGVLGAIAAVAIILAVIFFLHRKNKLPCKSGEKNSRNESFTSVAGGPIIIRKPVKLKNFNEHLDRLHKDSNLLFQGEFEDVQEHSPKHFTQDAAALDGNKVKNRYVNILPYDHTRVKLTTDDEDEVSDFINANYIPGYTSPREYIATQGPMVSTIAHFWRMMWEQKSTVIVMLSDLQEKGRPKVDMYWPGELNSPVQYGDVIVELTSDSTLNRYTIRTFKICLETQPEDSRKVVQYFIPGWEDYSANLAAEELMDFITAVRQEVRTPVVGPIVVHCSAGVGRTGTFIALDFLMQFVRDHDLEDEVDIYNLVLNMRHNRPYMVQSERQYIFIHDALKVIIDKKIKEMKKDDDNIYQNEDNIYQNQAFVQDENLYENTSYNSKPITSL